MIAVAFAGLAMATVEVRSEGPIPGLEVMVGPARVGAFLLDKPSTLEAFSLADPRLGSLCEYRGVGRFCLYSAWKPGKGGAL